MEGMTRSLRILRAVARGERAASLYSWKVVCRCYRELADLGLILKDRSGRWQVTARGREALEVLGD